MKRVLSCFVIVALVFFLTAPLTVSATDIPDWDTIDWEEYLGKIYSDAILRESLETWLEHEASYPKFFEYRNYIDGEASTTFSTIAYKRFIAEPEAFLIALAETEEKARQDVLRRIADELSWRDDGAGITVLENVRLSRNEDPGAVDLLLALIAKTGEFSGVSIRVPKTGDPVMVMVLGLLLSGSGILLLRKKKIR